VIYDGRRQGLVEWKGQNQPEIELNNASVPMMTKQPSSSSVTLTLVWVPESKLMPLTPVRSMSPIL
jgi:hypothetical protein